MNDFLTIKELKEKVGSNFTDWEATAILCADGDWIVTVDHVPSVGDRSHYSVRHSVRSEYRAFKTLYALYRALSECPLEIVISTPGKNQAIEDWRQSSNEEQLEISGV